MTDSRQGIDDTELEGIARAFIADSLGGPGSEISAIRERNLRAYNAEASGDFAAPDIDDRSTFVSSDVADTVDGMLPQLLDVFVSDEKAVECKAKKPGPQAEQQAKQATAYLNYLFYTQNDGLLVLFEWLQDALTQKVGFVKVWAEEEAEDSQQTYEGQTEDQLAMLLMDGAELAGEPQVDDEGGLTFTVVNNQKRMRFKVECVAPSEMRVDPNANWNGGLAAVGEVKQKRRFELEEMGYDLEGIGEGSASDTSGERQAVLGDAEGEDGVDLHDSHRLYEYAELYLKLDVDGDGVAEWSQVCLINGNLVNVEKTDDHPYEKFCLQPRAHAFFGDCAADRAYVIQKEQTNLSRALFDNVYFSTNQRTYVNTDKDVNIGDLLDNRPGGVVRGRGAPGDAFAPIPTVGIPASAWNMQEWLATKLESRTGFTRYSQGMDADSLNKTATGINIITSKSDMRLRLMTRFAAVGLRGVFAKLLKLATKHQDRAEQFEVNGQWIEVNPTEWRDQFNIKINVGLGHGTREQKMGAVMAMLPLQQTGVQMGVVRPEHIANTIRLAAEVNEFKNPEQFCDEAPTGALNPQQQKEMQEQLQALGQENQQLKAANESKQGELEIKSKELDLKHAEFQRKEAETAIQAHQAQQGDDSSAAIGELQQQVAALTAVIQSLFAPQEQAPQGYDPSAMEQPL